MESKTACARTFGDKWCGVTLANFAQAKTIATVSGKLISSPTLLVPPNRPANYFSYGRVVVDGLSIGIVDGSGGVNALRLSQTPPPEWAGATGVFYPGCDKSFGGVIGCTGWANTARFFGAGIVKPVASPVLTPR